MKVNGMSRKAFIGVGSNLGDKITNCLTAMARVDRTPGCRISARSGLFRTEPVGVQGHDWYANAVIAVDVAIPARPLLERLLSIEVEMGRKRKRKWDPRTIDLDILLFGQEVIDEKDLTVPHPLMHLRKFVLVPMVQLVPDLRHPVLHHTMKELLDNLPGEGQAVIPLEGA